MHKLLLTFALCLPLIVVANVTAPKRDRDSAQSITYTAREKEVANDIYLLSKSARRGKINSKVFTRLTAIIGKTPLFSNLKTYVNKIGGLHTRTDSIARLRRECTTLPKAVSNNFDQELIKSMRLYCDSKFLTLLHKKKESTRLNKKNLRYFIGAIPRFVTKKNAASFSLYLKKVKTNIALHRYISLHIGNHFIEKKIRPIPSIINKLYHTTALQNYLNSLGYYSRKEKRKVVKTIRAFSRSFEKLIGSGQRLEADLEIEKLIKFYKKNNYSVPILSAWRAFIINGKVYRYAGEQQKANKLFQMALDISSDDQIDEALFQLLWGNITNMKYDHALKQVEAHNMIERFSKLNSKLKFWIAYVIKKNGEIHLAKHLYSELVNKSPLNYYSIIALKELASLEDKETNQRYFRKISSINFSLSTKLKHHTKEYVTGLRRLAIWMDLGLQEFAKLEVKKLVYLPKDKVFSSNIFRDQLTEIESQKSVIESIASLLSSRGHHLQTFKLVQNAMGSKIYNLDRKTLRYLFPLKYISEVEKFADSLDPLFVLSLIRQESAFNPKAKSRVGARGLMQLMPNTARQFKRKIKKSQLNDPHTNIKIGVKYLKNLLTKYDGNMIYALSAYNAGESRVKKWKKTIFTTDNPLIIIESIPFKETRLYVKLIYRNLFFYNFLKGSLDFQTPIDQSFKVSLK
ncbi:MAG: lytic transglycosylase domain-containing protein [Bacteriovoracaceae bacterium]|nr:lytic transglycosylase domain-containing protein [Bacteriovoracaceae bacterium]